MSEFQRFDPPEPPEVSFDFELLERLRAASVFHEDTRLEVLNGRLVTKPPEDRRHIDVMDRLARVFDGWAGRLPDDVSCRDHARIVFDDGDTLVADFAFGPAQSANGGHWPADLHLVVEVAYASLRYEQGPKRMRYARGAIAEHWLADVLRGEILISRDPRDGDWRTTFPCGPGEAARPAFAPDVAVSVDDVFG